MSTTDREICEAALKLSEGQRWKLDENLGTDVIYNTEADCPRGYNPESYIEAHDVDLAKFIARFDPQKVLAMVHALETIARLARVFQGPPPDRVGHPSHEFIGKFLEVLVGEALPLEQVKHVSCQRVTSQPPLVQAKTD